MDFSRSHLVARMARNGAVPLLAGFVYFAVALATLLFTDHRGGIAPIWISNALLVAVILHSPKAQTLPIIAMGLIGNALSVVAIGGPMPSPIFYAIANMTELAVLTIGLRGHGGRERILSDPGAVMHVLLWCGLLAPGTSAVLGALTSWSMFGAPIGLAFLRWYLADALGLLIFLPFFIALFGGDFVHGLREMTILKRLEFTALLTLTATVTGIVFFVAKSPLLFAVVMPLILVAFRTGWLGSKIALTIVAVVGGVATMSGVGPIASQVHDPNMQIYGLQIFIAAMVLILMPVAAALAARETLNDKLRESEQSLRLLASRSPILLFSFDLDGICQRVVGTSDILLDREPANLIGATFPDISEEGQYALRKAHNAALDDISRDHTAEFRAVQVRDKWLEAVFRAHFDETGHCVGTIATIHDVTQRKNQELSLSRTATTDSLTGLLNRAGFATQLEQAMLNAAPGSLSIAMIDVDRFKLINDNSGHQVGDIVLREIAQRIGRQVRTGDAVGRLGGDEFVILLATANWDMVQDICSRIVTAVSVEPVMLPSGNGLRAAISCGVARLRADATAETFLHEADLALYEAKRAGRNRVVAA